MKVSKPRIKLVAGRWHAFPGCGPKKQRNLALVPAINFCKRLNSAQKGADRG